MKISEKFEFIKRKPARNRMVMPPMDTLMADEGNANEFHIQHYGARSYGGFGTIVVESTAVSKEGKIRAKDLGLWKDSQIKPLARVAKVIKLGGALAGLQINHAGGKAESPEFPRLTATMKYDYLDQSRMKLVTKSDLKSIEDKFVKTAIRAKKAGFDFVEIHAAHGYLLNQLIQPYLNEVSEGTMIQRAKIVINIVNRIKKEAKIPAGIRFSVADHVKDGLMPKDFKDLIKAIDKNIIYIHASSGESVARVRTDLLIKEAGTKLYRVPLAKQIKKLTTKPVITVGNFSTRADLDYAMKANIDAVAIGRESIFNPNFPITSVLKVNEIDGKLYHWNNNIWYNHHDYLDLMIKLKLK